MNKLCKWIEKVLYYCSIKEILYKGFDKEYKDKYGYTTKASDWWGRFNKLDGKYLKKSISDIEYSRINLKSKCIIARLDCRNSYKVLADFSVRIKR